MRRPSLAEPPISAPEVLHPTLQAALGSLDVQLEVELARYRRQRRTRGGRAKPSAAPKAASSQQRHPKPIDMIAIGAIGGRTQPRPEVPPDVALDPSGSLDQDLWQQPLDGSAAAGHLTIASDLSPKTTASDAATSSQSALKSGHSASRPHAAEDQLEAEYFASSEELLRSLAEEDVALQTPQRNWLADLLTPLGIGSLLLLLLSSATIGYLILNPASLRIFKTFGIHKSSQNDPAPAATTAREALPGTTSPDLASEEFKDLNLDTLSTLPKRDDRLPAAPAAPSLAASPTALPNAVPGEGIPGVARMASGEAGRSSRVNTSAPRVQPALPQPVSRRSPEVIVPRTPPRSSRSNAVPQTAPLPRRSAARTSHRTAAPQPVARVAPPRSVSPAPAPAAAPVATAPAAPDGLHYVVTPYSGDRSLEQARQTSPDAYVRNFPDGARIQLGAFSDPARARELSQQLEQQGVSTQVYQP